MSQTPAQSVQPELLGKWAMSEGSGRSVSDSSGQEHTLTTRQELTWVAGPKGTDGAIKVDQGVSLGTERGVIDSDQSFSVAAWLRLDSDLAGTTLVMPENWFAWTAVAQSGPYHSPFYLGARQIEYGGEGTGDFHLHWNFTVAPLDGTDDGPVDWVHAYSSKELTSAEADQWVLLVGVYDLDAGEARIYVPTREDRGQQKLPEDWPKWQGKENLQLGHAWFRDEFVDQWPGSIGPVWMFRGALTEDDARSLRERGEVTSR